MGIFGGFRAKFSKDSSRKNQKKEDTGVVCTSYRVFSEFNDEKYIQPSYKQPTALASGSQNGLKTHTSILKTPSTTSTLQEGIQIETITVRKQIDNNRKAKAKSQYELSTFSPDKPSNVTAQSVEDLPTITAPQPPPRPASKPTPKTRKSIENLAQNDTNGIYEYPSYSDISEPSTNRVADLRYNDDYIEPDHYSQPKKYNTEGIYHEPKYDDQKETVAMITLQNSEGAMLESRSKKVRKEKGRKREEKIVLKETHSVGKNSEASSVSMTKEEKNTVTGSEDAVTNSISVQFVELSSKTIKTGNHETTDYDAYFNQKASNFGYSTSQAASIFFQDDDDNEDHYINDNRDSWKGVKISEITDDDESRRVSSIDC